MNVTHDTAWELALAAVDEYHASSMSEHMATWTRGRIAGLEAIAKALAPDEYWKTWRRWDELRELVQ